MKLALMVGVAFAAITVANLGAAQAQTIQAVDEVVVTGSRVITNGNNAPTPLTVINPAQALATAPTTLYDNLAQMPEFSGSRGANNGPVDSSAAGDGAVSTLNLRNMGPQRTLILFDGHRVPPSTPDGLVDVGALPQMLIQRIDVVTGGASAVYGSDAVTGVVNYITDSKFNGLKLDLQGGVAQQGDARTYQIGIAGGHSLFDGRGHIEGSYQRQHNDGLFDDQRDWAKPRWTVQGNGADIPWHLQANAANGTASYGGAIACLNGTLLTSGCPSQPLVGQTFAQNGVLSAFNPGQRGASAGLASRALQIGGDGVYFTNVSFISKTRMDQFFGRFDYSLSDNVSAYVSASYSDSTTAGNSGVQRTFPPGWYMGSCNPYLSSQIQAGLGCVPADAGTSREKIFSLEKAFDPASNYGFGQNNRQSLKNFFVIANLQGKFGEGYRWEATYTHSNAKLSVDALDQNWQHAFAAVDAAVDPVSKNIVCRVTLTNPSLFPGCVPINMFGPTAVTRQAIGYIFDTINNTSENKLDGVSGSITGSPFRTWAGPIDMALSGEMRKLTLDLSTNALASELMNCTGLRFGNCDPESPIRPDAFIPINGVTQTVKEAAIEANVPLLKDVPLFQSLNFVGSARYTDYNNNSNSSSAPSPKFNATTWKAGAVWQVNDMLTLRLVRSRDIRAPNLYDLYQPSIGGSPSFAFDFLLSPTGGIQAAPFFASGGNPSLKPEVAKTTTLGIVFRPTPQLSLAIDAYSIDVHNVLYTLDGSSEPNQKACYNSGGASPLCQLQTRPFPLTNTTAANQVTTFFTRQVNIARQKTSGVDIEANYRATLFDQPLTIRGLATYQPHIYYYLPDYDSVQDTAGVAYPQIGGLPAPVWKATVFASFKPTANLTVDLSERYRSRLHWSADPTQNSIGGVASVFYTNATVSYEMSVANVKTTVFLNIQNLFDKDPPPAGRLANNFPGSFPGVYAIGDDPLGRYFTLGLHLRY